MYGAPLKVASCEPLLELKVETDGGEDHELMGNDCAAWAVIDCRANEICVN